MTSVTTVELTTGPLANLPLESNGVQHAAVNDDQEAFDFKR